MPDKQAQNGTRTPGDVEMAAVNGNDVVADGKLGHVNPVDVLGDEDKRELEAPPAVVLANGQGTTPTSKPQDGDTGGSVDDDVIRRKQEKRDKAPLWYCRWICNWPKVAFFLTLAGHIMFLAVTGLLMKVGYDIIPITFDRIPLDIRDDVDYLRDMAWDNVDDEDNTDLIIRGTADGANQVVPERTEFAEIVEMYFEMPGGNVFTKENLLTIKRVEEEYFNNAEFQAKFCQLDHNGVCRKSRSILRYFDGTFGPTFDDPGFDNIADILYRANTNTKMNKDLQFHLGKNAMITPTVATSSITRSYILLGMPLAGYKNSTDREEEQTDAVKKFVFNEFKGLGDRNFEKGVGNMDFFYNSISLISVTITSQVMKDMSLAIGSLLFIILFMYIQVGSFWVSLFAVLSIMTSFLCANIIYRCILDYRYFGIFHVLALFIILGIGADDIFVFMDTWKETSHHSYKSTAHRMSDCYRKASMAMLFTSLTTAQAFIVSATSPFLGIGSFGVFAGILVFVNYISVIVFFPTVVVMYHKYFEKYRCCCCCVKPGYHDAEVAPETPSGQPKDERRKNPVVRFFRGRYFDFVTHKIARWIILAFYLILTVVFIYFASTLQVNEEQLKFLKDSTNFGKYLAKRTSEFSSRGGSETLSVHVVWGLDLQDISSCHHTDVKCTGKTVWDDTFDINKPGAQQALLDFCNKIRSLSQEKIDELRIQKGLNDGLPEVDCFIESMGAFMNVEDTRTPGIYPAGTDISLPITAGKANTIMTHNSDEYTTIPGAGFQNNFEVAMSYWLYNGFQNGMGPQMARYGYYLGEGKNSPYTMETNVVLGPINLLYQYGTKLKYAAITINTTIIGNSIGYPTGIPIRNAWEEFVSAEIADMPDGLKGGFQMGNFVWHWLKVQEMLTSSAVVGIVIGLCVALPLLILATSNVIIGLLATLTLCCIIVCVVAMIPIAGWKLGLLESLNLVLVVGLSVDYVVHLAEGYSRSSHDDRLGRTRDTLEEVGISVLSGAVTTLGASMFLLFAQILFFTQFGVFMFCTILFSILYALGFFVTLIAIIGPQNEFGSLKPFYRWCAKKCCCKKSSN